LLEKAEDFAVLNEAVPSGAQMLSFHRADIPFLNGEIMRGIPIHTEPPPTNSSLGHSGVVVLKVHVDTTGAVASAEAVSAPDAFLSAAAVAQVKRWRYSLSYVNGKVVPIDQIVRIQF
jgi:TonB family protein